MSVKPRRVFASSVVLTVVGSLAVASAAPAPGPKRPPPKKEPPPKEEPKAPTTDRHWRIFKQGKTCFADDAADSCPPQPAGKPIPPCNPPSPTAYACPDKLELPATVIQRAGTTYCTVVGMPITCPPGVSCNPPPPRKVICP